LPLPPPPLPPPGPAPLRSASPTAFASGSSGDAADHPLPGLDRLSLGGLKVLGEFEDQRPVDAL
jgi:hypothetical protein